MAEREYVECTSSIIQAFVMFKQLYPDYMTKEFTKSIEIAVQFIESKQMLDGSWYGTLLKVKTCLMNEVTKIVTR